MAKVTSKLQVTVPKVIAEKYGISPGDEIEFLPAGDAIRLVPLDRPTRTLSVRQRLRLFDEATERQTQRDAARAAELSSADRGWTRAEIYERARAR